MVSSDIAPGLDPSLHTVTEEDEGSVSSRSHSINTSVGHSMHELTVTSERGSAEDEILSTLITLTFEFLSKDTKPKIDADLVNTDSQQVYNIVNYFGKAMAFEPSLPWKVHKSTNLKRFRFDPYYFSFHLVFKQVIFVSIKNTFFFSQEKPDLRRFPSEPPASS